METRKYDGLSPSSAGAFLTCQRKYWHKKIGKTERDADLEEDTESLRVGKAFHKCLEDTRHTLAGYGMIAVAAVVEAHELTQDFHTPLIFAMLRRYQEVHEKSGLHVVACEQAIDTPSFFGIVDAVMDNKDQWWIVDMKTAASFSPSLVPGLARHPQLNLYAHHRDYLAAKLDLDPDSFGGCRYRLTTKSKVARRQSETIADYVDRLASVVKSMDFVIPAAKLDTRGQAQVHEQILAFVSAHKDEAFYVQNFGNCTQYYRPCEFWSKCHGESFGKCSELEVITSR